MLVRRLTDWASRYGIALPHWLIFGNYAEMFRYYIFVRAGKEASIRWILRNYPAKPLEMSFLKVDPIEGLLFARNYHDRQEVFALGHYVLVPAPQGEGHGFVAQNRTHGNLPTLFREEWAQAGVVLERSTRQPFTSDYDLGAIVNAANITWDHHHNPPSGLPLDAKYSRANWKTAEVSGQINQLFGNRRIMHGPQALLTGDIADKAEDVLVFGPDKLVTCYTIGKVDLGFAFYDILADLLKKPRTKFMD